MMNPLRRTVLRVLVAAAGAAAGILKPLVAAADWNKTAFEAKTLADVLKGMGAVDAVESVDILIKAPEIAESGVAVPVEIVSRILDTRAISIISEKNPQPLVASFNFAGGAQGFISTRIKMAESANIRAVVDAGGRRYFAAKLVKVTIGGCGG